MLNKIWAGMILIGIVYGSITGKLPAIGDSFLDSSKEAITICITMLGVLAFWCGMMEVAKKAGILRVLTRKIQPFLHFMFPEIPRDHPALEQISTNVTANILGLGWAATPAGLKAMEELAKLEIHRGKKDLSAATNEMCTFLVLNISSLQLIPVNIIAYRSQYGSPNPTAIVFPAIAATCVSTLVGILFCKTQK